MKPLDSLAHSVAIAALIWTVGGLTATRALDGYLHQLVTRGVVERAPDLTRAQMPAWKHSWYKSEQRERLNNWIKDNIK